jgi:DNA-binding response OmpR family regulator
MAKGLRNGMAELLTDIDGLPILLRFFVHDVAAEMHSELVPGDADIHSLLSSTLEKMVKRMSGSALRLADSSKRPLAMVEIVSGGDHVARQPAPRKETMLRVGALEIDLIDRTAKRGDRQIDLRPREFRLLKYMMQRSGKLLTREMFLKEVWQYKFVPETNLVDVHMGRLRRKVDGANETPMIRNVRGAGFVLSTPSLSQGFP